MCASSRWRGRQGSCRGLRPHPIPLPEGEGTRERRTLAASTARLRCRWCRGPICRRRGRSCSRSTTARASCRRGPRRRSTNGGTLSFRPDPVTFEVVANALDSIADQMAITLMRSAYSPIVRDSLDYSTALFDREGRMLAQGLTTPLHLGSFPDAMRHLIATHGGRMREGDIYCFNEPYGHGGMHLPDIYAIQPLFWEGEVAGYAAALAHHTDVGGLTPGSNTLHSTEIFQEGLRIPLLKLYDEGRPNETLFAILRQNVRVPDKVEGDLRAQVAACRAAERAYADLLARHGVAELHDYAAAMLDHAEARTRAEIAAIPDGTYR